MRDRSLDVAVTGIYARLPGAPDVRSWWAALIEGRVLTRRYKRSELLEAGVPLDLIGDADYVPVRGHLDGAERFDNALFRVSPREAELMDPQHRLMLEAVWAALEDAATPSLDGVPRTGVFASMTGSSYLRNIVTHARTDPAMLDDLVHGCEPDFVASRIAYKLGLTGPALAIQTACSSSLVAVHLAVRALIAGDCDQAAIVASGLTFPQSGYLHFPGGVLSASGYCRPFDEGADGVVAGSGVACVILRRLADALADGPRPYGVIIGTAINNDGAAKAGYFTPSAAGQEAVIQDAARAADVDGSTIGYLEAHGTGTPIGDPIEWSAASSALRHLGGQPGQVAIGALKANVGHLDAAAGVIGLIKALLVVREGIIPPVAGFTRLNPLLEVAASPLYVPTEAAPWSGPLPRRAGVSSFGIGGTNAHVLVEQPPEIDFARCRGEAPRQLVILSAANAATLSRMASRLGDHLNEERPDLADVSFTLAAGRVPLPERLALTGCNSTEVAERLEVGTPIVRGTCPATGPAPVIFLFPGQGTQYPGMALPYAQALAGFSDALEQCLTAFDVKLAGQVRAALFDPDLAPATVENTELAQPALFAVGYAAATALSGLGVNPAAVIGHSVGEIAAACVAGAFDLTDATRVVAARGRAMRACPSGAMLALGCSEAEATALVSEMGLPLDLAAVNSQTSCVVTGALKDIEALRSSLAPDVFARRLRTSHGFHSALMQPAVQELADELAQVSVHALTVPLAANLTGQLVPGGERLGPWLLAQQVCRTVRFGDAMAALAERFPGATVVDVGPGRALSAAVEESGLDSVALSPGRTDCPAEEVLLALGALWTLGVPINTDALSGAGQRIHLPSYPFAGPSLVAPEARGARAGYSLSHPAEPLPADALGSAARPAESASAPWSDATVRSLIATLWTELLGHANVSAESDFFHLGGDSLLITRLARALNEKVGIRVPTRDLLAAQTLERQVGVVLALVRE